MKTIKSTLMLLCLLLSLKAGASESYNWYFKATEPGNQPIIFGDDKMPDKYDTIYMGDPNEKVIYLTFDAGYCNENVVTILDVLKEENVPGCFFILPAIIKYDLPVVERMVAEGHIVANHSYSHKNMATINDISEFEKELKKLEDCYSEATGLEMSKYFRPPEGTFSEETLRFCQELGYRPVFWSFAYRDWDNSKQPDLEESKAKVINSAHNGEVMLLHPTSETNAKILKDVIQALKAQGYTFKTLDEFK